MGAARKVEQQPVRRGDGHHRRESIAKVGQPFHGLRFRFGIVRDGHEIRHARPCIGQGHAGLEAEPERGFVQRMQPESAALLDDEGKRRRVRRRCARKRLRPRPPLRQAEQVRCQKGEDERQEAPLA